MAMYFLSHVLSVLTLTLQKKHFAIELNKTSTSIIEVLTHPIGNDSALDSPLENSCKLNIYTLRTNLKFKIIK